MVSRRVAPQARKVSPLALLLGVAMCTACGASLNTSRFALRPPMWEDDDRRAFRDEPSEIYNPAQWDRIDHTLFRPLSEVLLFRRAEEAVNVNALDEVPSSSWFENRIGQHDLLPARIARGGCDSTEPVHGPFTVTRAKPAGSSPGMMVRTEDGRQFLFKVDFDLPERGTAADSIGTRIFWAAGYHVPCNRVVIIDTNDLVLPTEATNGRPPPTLADVDRTLSSAVRLPNGLIRASLSEFIQGEPLGGWRFSGRRTDDPNDVIDHDARRDVRGMVVLSAWLNHIDSRAENNLDAWIEAPEGGGYLRHYVLDVGDSFGQVFPDSLALSQSFGLAWYFDLQQVIENLMSVGIVDRPYFRAERGPAGDVLGFFDVERFDPAQWHNGYPNPAFDRATERDRAWMARIISRFGEEHLRAAVETGRFSREEVTEELIRILMGRRERILERYLTRLSPLSLPEVEDGQLCLHDLMVEAGLRDHGERRYHARGYRDWPATSHALGRGALRAAEGRVCVRLPSEPSTMSEPSYWVIDVLAETPGRERTFPARVHLYQVGERDYRIVGLERPASESPPRGAISESAP